MSKPLVIHNLNTNIIENGIKILTIENYMDGHKGLEFKCIYKTDTIMYKIHGTEIRPTQFYITENNKNLILNIHLLIKHIESNNKLKFLTKYLKSRKVLTNWKKYKDDNELEKINEEFTEIDNDEDNGFAHIDNDDDNDDNDNGFAYMDNDNDDNDDNDNGFAYMDNDIDDNDDNDDNDNDAFIDDDDNKINLEDTDEELNNENIYENMYRNMPMIYRNINIEYNMLYTNNFDVKKILNNIPNIFCIKHIFIDDKLDNEIVNIKNKYFELLDKIFNNDENENILFNILKTNNTFCINLINEHQIFSPHYIVEKYNSIGINVEDELLKTKNLIKDVLKNFRDNLILCVNDYENKKKDIKYILIEHSDYENYKNYIINIINIINDCSLKLINLNTYPINLLINNVIEQYTNIKLSKLIKINNQIAYEI
jgi:hypothetical protein